MSIFLVLLAIALLGGTAVLAAGLRFPLRGGRRVPAAVPGLAEPVASLPPVLLPDNPAAADVGRVRFGLGLRGYRMDQVDEVLDRLAEALAARDARIEDLLRRCPSGGAER